MGRQLVRSTLVPAKDLGAASLQRRSTTIAGEDLPGLWITRFRLSSVSSAEQRGAALGLAALGFAYGWVAAGARPFTQPAEALTGVPIVVVGVALVGSRRRASSTPAEPEVRRLAPWLALALATLAWELREFFAAPRHDYPTLSSMGEALLRSSRPVHALLFTFWLALGWRLARGTPWRGKP